MRSILLVFIFIFLNSGWALASQPLKVVSTERPLLQYMQDGELKGPSAEIYKMLMKEAELKAEVNFVPWARAYYMAESQPDTMIFSLIRNKEREQKFHWIIPVSQLMQTFVGKSASISKEDYRIELIKQKKTAVVRNTFAHRLLLSKGFKEGENLYVASTLEKAHFMFFKGRTDFVFIDPNVTRRFATDEGLTEDDLIMDVIFPEAKRTSYIAVNIATDPDTVQRLKQAAEKIIKQPEYQHYLDFIDLE